MEKTNELQQAKLYAAQAMRCLSEGKHDEAIEHFRSSIALKPDFVEAHTNLGIVLFGQGKLDAAIAAYHTAIRYRPDFPLAYIKLGQALHAQGEIAGALETYRKAAALGDSTYDLHLHFGAVLQAAGQAGQAAEHYRRAVELKPGSHAATLSLIEVLLALEEVEEARAVSEHLTELRPGSAQAHAALASVLLRQGKAAEAVASCNRAIELQPDLPAAHAVLGGALQKQGKMEEALAAWQRAITLDPTSAEIHFNVGGVLRLQARLEEAVAAYRRAIDLKPDFYAAHSALIFTMNTAQMAPMDELLALAKSYGDLFPRSDPLAPEPRAYNGRKLKVGILTAELSGHAVSSFLATYLRHYDKSRIHLTLYLTVVRNDDRSRELVALADQVRNLASVSDAEAHDRIKSDCLDLVIETSAHSHGGRLPILARRCAPVQCHYIGYHGTTGLPAIDYFIGDAEITPPAFDGHFSERLYRLPRLWIAYTPLGMVPEPRQSSGEDRIVLGSFNTLTKVREETLALWARVLKHVPQAQLLVKDSLCSHAFARDRLFRSFAAEGISGDRLLLLESSPSWHDHMAMYNHVDIALDTLPQSSSTTGFDAIYMGTPLVAFRSGWTGGRMSSSIVKALGHPDWIARTADEYVEIVKELASSKARLRQYKELLRTEMLRSELCDGPSLAAALEAAFAHMMQDRRAAGG